MGTIKRFEIDKLIKKYNLKNYVETGTGSGTCLEYAMRFSFDTFYSIEIHNVIYEKVQEKFSGSKNLKILLGNSYDRMPEILSEIEGGGNTMFFLDAHFPGVDFGHNSFLDEKDDNKRIPLQRELEVIKQNRDISSDIIIADDLRIYEDGPFEGGNWNERHLYGGNGIGFIEDLFGETHKIQKSYKDQGYIILAPLDA